MLVAVIFVMAVAGCSNMTRPDFYGEDLTDKASLSASVNSKNVYKLTDDSLSSCWTSTQEGSYIDINFDETVSFNTVLIEESTDNVKEFSIYFANGSGEYEFLYKQDRIDEYRLCATEDTVTDSIRIVFDRFDKR